MPVSQFEFPGGLLFRLLIVGGGDWWLAVLN